MKDLLAVRAVKYGSSMAESFSGKIAFVTGGASGIGATLTTSWTPAGTEVWIADRQIGAAQAFAQLLNSGGAKAHAIELDVRDFESFERAVAEAVKQSARIDYLFNNAGSRSPVRSTRTRCSRNDVRRKPTRRGPRHPSCLPDHDSAALRPHREYGLHGRSRHQLGPGELQRHQARRGRDLEDVAGRGRSTPQIRCCANLGGVGPPALAVCRCDGGSLRVRGRLLVDEIDQGEGDPQLEGPFVH